ncbi:MAG: hypothetical protein P4L76_16185 [Beijerinckiaceae bacterium]|nr:hypothetical protein [Beijerinckiaceae bacterium]
MRQQTQMVQTLAQLLAAFTLAYLVAGFLHGLVAVAVIVFHGHDFGQTLRDTGIFLLFIASEAIEAPLSGGFLRDPGNDGAVGYTNLYPFIAPVFVLFYFILSRVWQSLINVVSQE